MSSSGAMPRGDWVRSELFACHNMATPIEFAQNQRKKLPHRSPNRLGCQLVVNA